MPPTVVPCCIVSFHGRLDEDAVLGDVCSVLIRGEGPGGGGGDAPVESDDPQAEPWYLERVEVSTQGSVVIA